MRVWLRIIVGGIALWTALELPAAARDKRDDAVTREKMGQIFQSVHALLPLTATPKAFRDPKRQPEIYVALRALANNASALAEHIQERDRGAGFLGHSFARGARETLRQYDQGRYDSAEFRIQRMTEYCIACHARLASPRDSPLAADFIDETALNAMSLQERARIQIATRRFDDALTTLEQIFASPSIHPAEMLDPMTNYLIVCIRVRGDFERPLPTLKKLAQRPDLWRYLRSDIKHWILALPRLRARFSQSADLASARAVLDEGKLSIRFPADRQALVHYIVASGILQRHIEAHRKEVRDAAEAYYLLGLIELRIGRSYDVSQTDFYLETSIRLAPESFFAERSYALIEEETVFNYTDPSGALPPEVMHYLAELRELIDAN